MIYAFQGCELDEEPFQLRRGGEIVKHAPQDVPTRLVRALAALLLVAASGVPGSAAGEPVDPGPRWREAVALEQEGRALERDQPMQAVERYLAAARRFEAVAGQHPDWAQPLWRSARGLWMAGDTLPLEAKDERIRRFEAAEALSSRGIAVDPECAECMLWKFASMGRLRTTRFVWTSLRQVPEMAALLDRAIALRPSYREDAENSTLGNLHYSSAIFYRVLPDSFWVDLLLGVRGDKDRALYHIQTARSMHPGRLDYQIELGSQLLCLGSVREDPLRLLEGREVHRRLRRGRGGDDGQRHSAAQASERYSRHETTSVKGRARTEPAPAQREPAAGWPSLSSSLMGRSFTVGYWMPSCSRYVS